MKSIAISLISAFLTACAVSSGQQISQEQTSALKIGVTTVSEVTSAFGNPTTRIQSSDGGQTISYSHFSSQVKGATFVPIVGLFAGGASSQGRTVTMRFDRAGVLVEVITSDASSSSGPLIK